MIGAITDRDICMAALLQGSAIDRIVIDSVMSNYVVVCKASDGLDTAERLMREHRVRRLPVVGDREEIVGVLSLNDLANRGAAAPDVAVTLAAVCAPRIALATH